MIDALSLLQQRRSVPSRQLGSPAPDDATLHTLLTAAVRVPDHGKLVPFRLIRLSGPDKDVFGERLAALALREHPAMSPSKLAKESARYSHAPLVIVVVARVDAEVKVPVIEQQLAAGCVAHNLLFGAHALGFGAQWLTGWAAYDRAAAAILGLSDREQVIGFVHIGTPQTEIPERDRPAVADLLTTWKA